MDLTRERMNQNHVANEAVQWSHDKVSPRACAQNQSAVVVVLVDLIPGGGGVEVTRAR